VTTPEEYIRSEIDKDIAKIRDSLVAMQEHGRMLATAKAEHASDVQLPDVAQIARQLAEGLNMAQVTLMLINVTCHDPDSEEVPGEPFRSDS